MKPNTSGWGNLGSAPSPPYSGSKPRTISTATSAETSPGTSGSPSSASIASSGVRGPPVRRARAEPSPSVAHSRLERGDLGLVGVEERLHSREALEHLLRRHVGAAGEYVPARRQERRGRPAAHVVAAIHVGVAVVVHADGDEVLVDRRDDPRVRVAGLVHHVAPVAPHGGEGEEDRAPEPASLREGGLAPRAPLDLGGAVGPRGEPELAGYVHDVGIPKGPWYESGRRHRMLEDRRGSDA